ncbi:PH domain-containing protein [Lysinibacillus sp. G4S2]|uniref:PH domain-containing protein n=1 Tax=Lysinibacillus sp. G4S2 TaxID=3055859 RepID=UPI0025A21972|nr:PH domain-containing protein [Lysinibacillus sp. G4S2]MDM5250313.1 PH domain-containing protein [Lysinibacillus sp. G4S2]
MDTIAETIKFAGFGKKKAMANQIQMFDDRLTDQGETLLAVCASIKGTKQLYVTDQRIILHETKGIIFNDEKSIPLQSISSINISNTLISSTLKIVSTGNKAIIEDVPQNIALEIKNAIENLKKDFKTKSTKKEKDMYDIGDEIRELKALLEDGILTQEEFDAKKKQLLGI